MKIMGWDSPEVRLATVCGDAKKYFGAISLPMPPRLSTANERCIQTVIIFYLLSTEAFLYSRLGFFNLGPVWFDVKV
jgi:hypothetical protein